MGLLHDLRTVFNLAKRVNALEADFEEVQLEWADKKDAFELLLKRLAVRSARAVKEEISNAPDTGAEPAAVPSDNHDTLRAVARARGLRV